MAAADEGEVARITAESAEEWQPGRPVAPAFQPDTHVEIEALRRDELVVRSTRPLPELGLSRRPLRPGLQFDPPTLAVRSRRSLTNGIRPTALLDQTPTRGRTEPLRVGSRSITHPTPTTIGQAQTGQGLAMPRMLTR